MTNAKYVALCALVSAPFCDAFAVTKGSNAPLSSLKMSKSNNNSNNHDDNSLRMFGGAAASFLAGLGVAAQIAFADPTAIQDYPQAAASSYSSNILLSAGAPSFSSGGSFDTLDFSLPSYGDALKGDTESSPKKAPAFSASFPELKLPETPSSSPAPEPQKDDTAAAEAKAAAEAEKKAAADAKAEAKAAAEAEKKAAAEAAAQKKAEAQARKEQQKRLQQEMVEKANAAKQAELAEKAAAEAAATIQVAPPPAPAPAPASAPAPAPPATPDFEMPAFKVNFTSYPSS